MTTKIIDLLQVDLQNTGHLADLLMQERAQLEQRQIADLPALMQKKAELLASLEKNGEQRQALLQTGGFSPDAPGMQAFCEMLDQEPDAASKQHAASFSALQEQLGRCREMNLVNAAIVHRSKLNTGKLLGILKGRKGVPGLYTPMGAPGAMEDDSRTLGNA